MKGKQLAFVLVLLVVVGGIALYLNQRNSDSWSQSATSSSGKILDFPLNDVSQVSIQEGGSELHLARKDDAWRVKERDDYPADFDKVSALIRKLWELKPVQDVKIGPSQLARLQLTAPAPGSTNGTLLDLKGAADKHLATLLLGKKSLRESDQPANQGGGFPVGRYVMDQNGSFHAYLVSETFDEIQTKPEQWLSHDFIKIENPKSIVVAGTAPAVNWKIIRDAATSPWKLTDPKPGEELDNAKAGGVASIFTYGSFADVLPSDAPVAETGLDKPSAVHIETFDNFVYDLKIGKLTGENYPVLVSVKAELPKERTPAADEKPEDKTKLDQEFETKQKQLSDKLAKEQKLPARPYLIAKATVEQMLKDRVSLMAEKKPPASPASAPPAGLKDVPQLKSPVTVPAAGTPAPSTPRRPRK